MKSLVPKEENENEKNKTNSLPHMNMALALEEEEPASPASRLMQVPEFNICVLTVLGYATTIDVIYFKKRIEETLIKHPRFSSVLVTKDEKRYDFSWKRKNVNLDDHIFVPDLDPNMESPGKFVEDYTTKMSKTTFDFSKPLWEIHVLNLKTLDANATAIFKIHHSVGDGVSLISLLIACSKKISDPESLPVFPTRKKKAAPPAAKGCVKRIFLLVWMMILMMYYTVLDGLLVFATIFFVKDEENPLKGPPGVEQSSKRCRYVHRIVRLEDVKLIKNAMKVTVNDVLLGVTEAGLCTYLQKQYETQSANSAMSQKTNDIINKRRIRIAIAFNLRPSAGIEELAEVLEKGTKLEKGKWGNLVGGMFIPLRMFDDPLAYIRYVKTHMDKRKLSLQPTFQYKTLAQIMKVLGVKAVANIMTGFLGNTTISFSNVFGPQEEILLFGHPLNYIAPTVCGYPQALVLHYQSYAEKIIICLAADEKLIPNPHEICDHFQSALENIKEMVIKSSLAKDIN